MGKAETNAIEEVTNATLKNSKQWLVVILIFIVFVLSFL